MQIEVFSLCDAATKSFGKLNILGAFDTIWAAKIPVVYPHCAIALRVRFERIEQGEHRILVHFVDKDGKNVVPPLEGNTRISLRGDHASGSINLILNLQGIKFEQFGEYSIDLAIDGQKQSSLPLFVKERAKPETA